MTKSTLSLSVNEMHDSNLENKLYFRIADIDKKNGALLLQFSWPENLNIIDQSTIYSFFPWQYEEHEFENLLPYISAFGQDILNHQQSHNLHEFTDAQEATYRNLVGKTVLLNTDENSRSNTHGGYDPNTLQNQNSRVDELRCIVLEILAEEGLIPGGIK